MSHPAETRLALYAGGDLGFFDRLRIQAHIRNCDGCRRAVKSYAGARARLREECAEVPAGLDWDRLASEMTANINLGIAAGECVAAPPAARRQLAWGPALAMACASVLVVGAWILNVPSEQRESLARGVGRIWNREARVTADTSVYLEASRAGIQLKENGAVLTMMHPNGAPSVISVSTQGSMRARYVDSDTGQVTITNVYAQ